MCDITKNWALQLKVPHFFFITLNFIDSIFRSGNKTLDKSPILKALTFDYCKRTCMKTYATASSSKCAHTGLDTMKYKKGGNKKNCGSTSGQREDRNIVNDKHQFLGLFSLYFKSNFPFFFNRW